MTGFLWFLPVSGKNDRNPTENGSVGGRWLGLSGGLADAAKRWNRGGRLLPRRQLGQKFGRRFGDGGDGRFERQFGRGRRLLDAADLSNELTGRSLDLFGRGRGLKAAQWGDVSTHGAHLDIATPLTAVDDDTLTAAGSIPLRARVGGTT